MVKIAIFKYILQKSKHSTDGFTLPLVLGLGLFMLLTAITMIVRSSDDQISAQLQKQTIENLGIAEAGLNRTLGRLRSGDNSVFLRLTYDPIPPGATRSYFGYLTATDERSTATLETNMNDGGCGGYPHSISPPTDIFGGMANEGNYRLLAYR